MDNNVVCIYHEGCMDGIAAAHIVQKKFPNVRMVPCQAGHDPSIDDVRESIVYFVDISPSVGYLEMLLSNGNTVTVLDHHITSFEALRDVHHDRFEFVYDNDRSGCLIAHSHFFPEEHIPWYMLYIDDNDRWVHSLEHTKEINSVIQTDYRSLEKIKDLQYAMYNSLLERGKFLNNVREQNVRDAILNRIECEYTHSDGVVYQCYAYSDFANCRSLTGNTLLSVPMANGNLPDFCMFYRYDLKSGRVYVSLRGDDSRIDCSEIAKRFTGGGGHRNACGFEIDNSENLRDFFIPKTI